MKKERLAEFVAATVVILSVVFLLPAQTCAAASPRPDTQSNSPNRASVGPSSFTPNMPFGEAINILRYSTVPPLNIAVRWRDLEENADIYRDTPIGMDGLSGVPLRTHLKMLLASVSGGGVEKLGYVVDEGVIVIATQRSLPRKMKVRVYDVTDLVSEPANYRFMPGFGMPFGGGMMSFGGGMMPFGAGMMSFGGGMMPFGGGMTPYGGMGYGGRGSYGGMSPYYGAGSSIITSR
jgi:hypothetical protein